MSIKVHGHLLALTKCHLHIKFKTYFFQKPLHQSKPNFVWLWKGEPKFIYYINGPGQMTKMATMPIMW